MQKLQYSCKHDRQNTCIHDSRTQREPFGDAKHIEHENDVCENFADAADASYVNNVCINGGRASVCVRLIQAVSDYCNRID